MKDVLRKKITLTGWMHNRKALIVMSVLLAVVLWAVVMTDSATERTLKIPVTVNLENSPASDLGLRMIEDVQVEATVVVKGPWSVLTALTAEDVQVTADVSSVQKAGKQAVNLTPSRNSSIANYEILSCTPLQVDITCDYWMTQAVPVEVDTSALKVADEKTMQLGTPVLTAGKEGTLSVAGPQSIVKQIEKLVAKPEAEEALNETRNFSPELKAYTKDNKTVSLENCTVSDLTGTVLPVTVPVNFYKELAVEVEWKNTPKGLATDELLTVSPEKIKVIGPKDALAAMENTLTVGTVDFDHLTAQKYAWKFDVTLPDAVTCVDDTKQAAVTLDLSDFTKKTVALALTDKNVTFKNNAAGKTTAVEKKTISVTVYGSEESLEKVTASKLSVAVDLASTQKTGLLTCSGVVSASGVNDVWFYYGKDATGIPVYVNVS